MEAIPIIELHLEDAIEKIASKFISITVGMEGT